MLHVHAKMMVLGVAKLLNAVSSVPSSVLGQPFLLFIALHTFTHTCTVIQCPKLRLENGGVIITPTNRTVNSTAVYTCNGSYKLDKGAATRTCQDDGTWSGQTPECSE